MTNFSINFNNPWLLLVLIPAGALTLIPYFRSAKKYRRTRNRICSIVLHLVVMVLSIAVLAGINFQYDVPNEENEVILLVDKSESAGLSEDAKDEFVYDVIKSSTSQFKVGVVTFGYDQVYAAPLSNDSDEVYSQYLSSLPPDGTATDIASALKYAASLFEKPETARIVLLSDGIETDGTALSVIKTIAAEGIKVDTVHFPDEHGDEVRIVSSKLPDYTIRHGETFTLSLDLESSYEGEATLTMYDDTTMIGESVNVRLERGKQTVELEAILALPGLHKLSFEIESPTDTLTQNNAYNSFVNIEVFDKLLIIESIVGESDSLCDLMTDKKVTVVNSGDVDKMPKTLDELRNYDEVILVNVANSDMPDGFAELLYSYVNDVGGGLFTVCGNKEDANPNDELWEANAFTREDMYGSVYQQLLPVEAINYTPPVAVVIIIDCSGSMYDPNGTVPYEKSKLYAAKQGAESCLDALTERDWVGIMTFMDTYSEDLELTPRPQRDKILAAIDDIPQNGGGTIFTGALERAGSALTALTSVEKRHIILVTDGEPGDEEEEYGSVMKRNAELGITMSVVGIECTAAASSHMTYVLETYAGVDADNYHDVKDVSAVPTAMREDLEVPEIKDVNYGNFTPTIEKHNSVVNGIDENNMPSLDGFYGTKAKEGAEVVLMGEFVPIYAQWKVGKGMVGSFMCDLNGTWSKNVIQSDAGKLLVNNMVSALFPTESIRKTDIQLSLKEQNYSTQMNIFTDVPEDHTVEVSVAPKLSTEGQIQTLYPSSTEGFGRVSFTITEPGIYEIKVVKKDAEGNVVSEATEYKTFSYSEEYNIFHTDEECAEFLKNLSEEGGGFVLTESYQVFENAVKLLHKVVDPRIVFMIIALVAFILDIAVRKFKFKWLHEIIRDKRKGASKNA